VALSRQQLHHLARLGAKARLSELRGEIAAVEAFVDAASNTRDSRPVRATVGRRSISAAGRARIAAAQRARWAKVKANKVKTAGVRR
jgi:hypothetical protein